MTAINNPFLSIVPRKGEHMIGINEKTVQTMAEAVGKGKKILLISGDYGSGKSALTDKIEKIEKSFSTDMKIETWMFGVDIANQLRQVPIQRAIERKEIIFIDKFELSEVVDDKTLLKILDLIVELTKAGASFVISLMPKTLIRVFDLSPEFKSFSETHSVKPLLYPEVKELVLLRLNEVRTKKSDSLEPFTESELKDIWKKSKGNPRMILLILANLYEAKVVG